MANKTDDLLRQALALHEAGKIGEAERIYEGVMAREPGNVRAIHLLGLAASETGRYQRAIDLMERSIALMPRVAQFHNNLGEAYRGLKQYEKAVGCYRLALEIKPMFEAENNLGLALREMGKLAEAEAALERAAKLNGASAAVFNNLASVHIAQADRTEGSDEKTARLQRAVDAAQTALRLQPRYANARAALATALMRAGQLDGAVNEARQAIVIDSKQQEARYALSSVLFDRGELDEAITQRRELAELVCDSMELWSGLVTLFNYKEGLDAKGVGEEHRVYVEHLKSREKALTPTLSRSAGRGRRSGEPLRIGYCSPDFKEHAASFFIAPLLRCHDRDKFKVYCYSESDGVDQYTQRLTGLADEWRFTQGRNDDDVAGMIREDEIDVLIDLAVHTPGNRLPVFYRRPAPMAATYLGYPGTTGLSEIDYRITDPYLEPVGEELGWAERPLRVAHSYFCYEPPAGAPEVASLPAKRNGYVTFGSFNSLAKISAVTIRLWAALMREVEGSRMVLQAGGLRSAAAGERLARMFEAEGVEPARLEMRRPSKLEKYLGQMSEVDIALDTQPFNGGTTTCHFLWMGVPCVTAAGQTPVSRMGKSVLSNVGLEELVASSDDEFIAIAVALAKDVERLERLRAGMRERLRASRLCDAAGRTRDLEDAIEMAWRSVKL
jgi:predicted O-linked N-acetylglucosamine transferase (SPINDLY family)